MDEIVLSWTRRDPEQRLAFRGGRHTRVNTLLSFILGCLLTVLFYVAILPLRGTAFAAMFLERGWVPYFICFFSFWAVAELAIKWRKLALQRAALSYKVVPADPDFVLSPATVDQVVDQIYATVDDPKHFVLFNRIIVALSNLKNLGRVSDVDDILRAQAEGDEAAMETSYALVQGFVWAVPVLGFIGTVVGLSQAIGGFRSVLDKATDVSQISESLGGVTAGLSTAFETTLVALVAALVIQLVLTMLKTSEEEFLDQCREYCLRNVVGRLKLLPFEPQAD